MNEFVKTAIFSAVALVLCVTAVVVTRNPEQRNPEEVGAALFPDFTDPLAAKRMSIISYDDKANDFRSFEVKQVNGVWSLPSHANYPADANAQVADAATALMGVRVLGKVSSNQDSHAEYGVVEPQPGKPNASTKGLGKLIEIDAGNGKPLAQLIVGKEDKARTETGPATLRFARRPGNNDVLRVAIDVNKFPTKFGEWIEKDLLKLKAFDVQEVTLDDYAVDKKLTQNGLSMRLDKRMSAKLAFNDKENKWSLLELVDHKRPKDTGGDDPAKAPAGGKQPAADDSTPAAPEKSSPEKAGAAKADPAQNDPNNAQAGGDPLAPEADQPKKSTEVVKLKAGEELNDQKLNDLKSALADLKIIDVHHKPASLISFLKSEKESISRDDLESLASYGFYVSKDGIKSDQGEISVLMKDGVRYILQFGEIADDVVADESDPKDDKQKTDDKKPKGANRYLFVRTEFDDSVIPGPNLMSMPAELETPAKDKAAEPQTKPADTQPADPSPAEGKSGDQPAGETKPADAKSEGKANAKSDGKANAKSPSQAPDLDGSEKNQQPAKKDQAADQSQPSAGKIGKKTDEKSAAKDAPAKTATEDDKVGTAKTDDAKSDGVKTDAAKADEQQPVPLPDDKATPPKKEVKQRTPEQIAGQRKFIDQQNKRAQDEYDEKKKAGARHSQELNARFADWYYVVSDDVFRKIHLTREDIIKKKEAPKPDDGPAGAGGPGGFKIPDALKNMIPKGAHP